MNVGDLNPEELRAMRADKIIMVFQNMALLPRRTVQDNTALALELRNVDAFTRASVADRVFELVSLRGYGDRMPGELSSGMQRRVGLARAPAADPDILLMDEPISALDQPGQMQVIGRRGIAPAPDCPPGRICGI